MQWGMINPLVAVHTQGRLHIRPPAGFLLVTVPHVTLKTLSSLLFGENTSSNEALSYLGSETSCVTLT